MVMRILLKLLLQKIHKKINDESLKTQLSVFINLLKQIQTVLRWYQTV